MSVATARRRQHARTRPSPADAAAEGDYCRSQLAGYNMKKYILKSCLVCAAFLFCYAGAQNFEEPQRYYKPVQLDAAVRGTFNVTPCLRELLNCWELIMPDMVCENHTTMPTLCDARQKRCKEETGWDYDGRAGYRVFDLTCGNLDENFYKAWGFPHNPNYPHPEGYQRRAGGAAGAAGARDDEAAAWRRAAAAGRLPAVPNDTVMFWL